jgi:hypothetical protein
VKTAATGGVEILGAIVTGSGVFVVGVYGVCLFALAAVNLWMIT